MIVPPVSAPSAGRAVSLEPQDIYGMFHMCQAAWRRRDAYRDSGWILEYHEHPETNTQVLFIEERDTLYVVFRGSQFRISETDRRHNTMIVRRRPEIEAFSRSVRTHMGFTEKYHAVRDAVLSRARTSTARRIMTVGHSAGGALAILAFADFLTHEPDRISHAVTYGMPRLLNRAGARELSSYQNRIVRVINGADPVPRVPAALFGYRHVGTVIQIGSREGLSLVSFADHNTGYPGALRDWLRDHGLSPDPRFAP